MKVVQICYLSIVPLLLVLAGCGGSGGGGTISSGIPNSLAGIVATGAPMPSASVTLTCANGVTKVTSSNSLGGYTFSDLSGCTAPYVVTAVGQVNGTTESLVSVFPTEVSGSQNVNVTPLTHAIAATLASDGNPLSLATDLTSSASSITAATVNARTAAISTALSGMLTSAGVTGSFNPITGVFAADSTGIDKVLDNLTVDVKSSGVSITNTSGSVQDDMGSLNSAPAADFSSGSITLSNNTNFSSISPLPSQVLDSTIADVFQSQFNNCFASPAANRGNVSSLGASCQAIQIAADYLNDGKTGSSEFDGKLSNALYDGATFVKPQLIRYLSTSPTDKRALIEFDLIRSDKVTEQIFTVVEQSTNTGGVLKLRGNRRPFFIDVSGVVQKRTQVVQRNATTAHLSNFYATSLQFYIDFNTGGAGTDSVNGVKWAHVSGPLLPSTGVWLRRGPAGCDQYFTVWRDQAGSVASSGNSAANCSALWQLSSRAASSSDYDNWSSLFGTDYVNNPQFADAKISDSAITAIQPGTSYKFEVFLMSNNTNTPDYVFYQRLRSRPYAMGDATLQNGEIDAVKWNEGLQQSSISAITPPSSVAGLPNTVSSINVAYTRTTNAAPPFKVMVQVKQSVGGILRTQVDSKYLPIDPSYVSGDVISRDLTNGSAGWNNPQLTTGASTMNLIQLIARNRMGTIVLRDWKY